MEEKDVEGAMSGFFDFIGTVFDGVMTVLDAMPPMLIGIIVVVLLVLYLFRKARHG